MLEEDARIIRKWLLGTHRLRFMVFDRRGSTEETVGNEALTVTEMIARARGGTLFANGVVGNAAGTTEVRRLVAGWRKELGMEDLELEKFVEKVKALTKRRQAGLSNGD